MTAPDHGFVDVHLLQLPVALAARAREHFEGLTREFTLIALNAGEDGAHHVPARLMELVTTITAQFGGINSEADQRLDDAIERGTLVLEDHVLRLPPEAAPATRALGDIIDEADEYCLQGEHLLTLAFPPDLAAYRRWYLGQVLDQLAGKPAVAWPDSAERRSLTG